MKSLAARFGRFNLVGILGAIVQLAALSILTKCFRLSTIAATPIAIEIAVLHNLTWHERFTWRAGPCEGGRQIAKRAWRFHASSGVVSLAGNLGLMYFLVERLKAPALPSAVIAILTCSMVNFWLADRWVWR